MIHNMLNKVNETANQGLVGEKTNCLYLEES